ncbi:hypothetical protein NQZ68_026659 [Dissostichus eleginoides]|nr:hypothetical protein NQZ68_026659 [Dissostichus eleginoides]
MGGGLEKDRRVDPHSRLEDEGQTVANHRASLASDSQSNRRATQSSGRSCASDPDSYLSIKSDDLFFGYGYESCAISPDSVSISLLNLLLNVLLLEKSLELVLIFRLFTLSSFPT